MTVTYRRAGRFTTVPAIVLVPGMMASMAANVAISQPTVGQGPGGGPVRGVRGGARLQRGKLGGDPLLQQLAVAGIETIRVIWPGRTAGPVRESCIGVESCPLNASFGLSVVFRPVAGAGRLRTAAIHLQDGSE